MRRFSVCLAMCATFLYTAPVPAQQPENMGPNVNVVREVTGTLRLQTKTDKRFRGTEEWRLFVDSEGRRTMILTKDFSAANALQIMTAQVDRNFRPIDVYASYWTRDGYKGSIRAAVHGNTLRSVSEGPDGTFTEELEVPDEISVVTHGESMNGWYLWQGERDADGNHAATYFNFSPTPTGEAMVRGRLHPAQFQYLGTETVTVPAGTFEAERYLLMNIMMWISGDDRILVKQEITDEDKEYVLTKMETVVRDQP